MKKNLKLLNWLYKRVKISPLPNKRQWILLEDFTYDLWFKGNKRRIKIPAWFIFNWASIPRIFHIVSTPMSNDTIIAALVHDYLFYTKQYSLSKSDDIFNEVMEVCWVNKIKRVLLYLWLKMWSWVVRI